MKKFLSMLLAVAMVATLAIGASALGDAGLYTYDESDGEYWSPALAMFDKTVQGIWFEDGTVAGHNIAQLADGTFLEENAMANLKSGWYEVVLCNLGTKPEWFPAEVEGKLALTVRGDSTFTVKSENALNAGAIGMLMGNNCRAAELVDETGTMTGEYENITMNLDYATLPMGSVSSDVTARLVAACADISIADAVLAVENVFFGDLELSVSHKKGAWVFIGTEAEFKANTTRTDANTITGAGAGAAATEAPAAEAAPVEGEIEYAHYVASANDPYFGYDNTIDIDPSVVTWAQIKYRTITEKDSLDNTLTGQIYVSPAAEPFIPVKWNHTGNWETIVVDLTSVSEKTTLTSLWADSLGLGFRLDPMESNRDAEANTGDDPAAVLPDSAIDIAYVAFFETEEAAKAFDGVNGAVALVDASMLAAPSAATNGAVELLSEVPAAPIVEEAPVVEETPVVEEAPAVEETPVVEEVVEEEVVVEETVEEVVEEAPVVEETVEEAPQTFDFGVIAAAAALVSAAGYALSKKR